MYKILIIDSNSILGATFAGLLERSRYQVNVVAQFEDGITHYHNAPPDLILLGIDVDDPTPFATARSLFANVKLIALLSREKPHSDKMKKVLHSLRGCPIFYKPFRTEEVLAAIYAELIPQQT